MFIYLSRFLANFGNKARGLIKTFQFQNSIFRFRATEIPCAWTRALGRAECSLSRYDARCRSVSVGVTIVERQVIVFVILMFRT